MQSIHLDLGCGTQPRNPYGATDLHGVDIRSEQENSKTGGFTYTSANIALEPLPFIESYFDSVSAFDVLEHVPRQVVMPNGELRLPFIQLMNEIHRVLKPGGTFSPDTRLPK